MRNRQYRRHCSVTQTSFAGACFLAQFGISKHTNLARQPRSTPAHRHRWHYTKRCRFVGIARFFVCAAWRIHTLSQQSIAIDHPSNVTPQVLCTTPASRHTVLTRCSVMPNHGAHRHSASQPSRLTRSDSAQFCNTAAARSPTNSIPYHRYAPQWGLQWSIVRGPSQPGSCLNPANAEIGRAHV